MDANSRSDAVWRRVEIRAELMTRDTSHALDVEHAFSRDPGPLRDSLRGDAAEIASKPSAATCVLLGPVERANCWFVCHTKMKAYLSL